MNTIRPLLYLHLEMLVVVVPPPRNIFVLQCHNSCRSVSCAAIIVVLIIAINLTTYSLLFTALYFYSSPSSALFLCLSHSLCYIHSLCLHRNWGIVYAKSNYAVNDVNQIDDNDSIGRHIEGCRCNLHHSPNRTYKHSFTHSSTGRVVKTI